MTPTHRTTLAVLALALLALAGLPAEAQDEGSESLALATPDFDKSPLLQEASLVPPIPPRTLRGLLPASFAGLPKTSVDGKVDWIGPAGTTRVEGVYGGGERVVKILVLDPAGLPPGGREYMAPLAPGETLAVPGGERKGLRVGDFAGTSETLSGGSYARVQVYAGPRLRVSAESVDGLSADALVEAMKSVDFGAFAALAPNAPPDLSKKYGKMPGQ